MVQLITWDFHLNHIGVTEDIRRRRIEFEDARDWYLTVTADEGKYSSLVSQRYIFETWDANDDREIAATITR